MRQYIDTRYHDLRSGQVVDFQHYTDADCPPGHYKVKAAPAPLRPIPHERAGKSTWTVRQMQRELLRRNRAGIRAGKMCFALVADGIVFYYNDATYGYRTVQWIGLVP